MEKAKLQLDFSAANPHCGCEGEFSNEGVPPPNVTSYFQREGFVIFQKSIMSSESVTTLQTRLEAVLNGEYNTTVPPTKAPKGIPENFKWSTAAVAPNAKGKPKQSKTWHVININKCDEAFRELALSPKIGAVVAGVCGWENCGVRFAQDQVWVKPPNCGPLTFHRDTTYFDFEPKEVCTVWITFDSTETEQPTEEELRDAKKKKMEPTLGPLEYCHGSQLWSEARSGSANQFFNPDYRRLVRDAAQKEGIDSNTLQFTTVRTEAGGCAVHNGRTWHGSGPNNSVDKHRRGIGLHYIRGDVKFKPPHGGDTLGPLWRPYKQEGTNDILDSDFPLVFAPSPQ